MIRMIRVFCVATFAIILGLAGVGCEKKEPPPAKGGPPPKMNTEAMQKKIQEAKQKYGSGGASKQTEKEDKDEDKDETKPKDDKN